MPQGRPAQLRAEAASVESQAQQLEVVQQLVAELVVMVQELVRQEAQASQQLR